MQKLQLTHANFTQSCYLTPNPLPQALLITIMPPSSASVKCHGNGDGKGCEEMVGQHITVEPHTQ